MKKITVLLLLLTLLTFGVGCSAREETNVDITVSFVTNGGTYVEDAVNKTVSVAPETKRIGFYFDGWYETADFSDGRVVFPYKAASTCKLYAKWVRESEGTPELSYTVSEDGASYTVTGCAETAETVWIPDEHNGKPVTKLEYGFLSARSKVTRLHIGKYVSSIEENFSWCINLTEYTVEYPNTSFIAQNGILYNADMTELIAYPAAKADASYTMPDSVVTVGARAFMNNLFLTEIVVGKNATYSAAFSQAEHLTYFGVNKENATYRSVEGVLFSADGKILYSYPKEYKEKDYTLPAGTEKVVSDAFTGSNVRTITINKECKEYGVSDNIPYLTAYSVEGGNAYFGSRDGVLFDADFETLYLFPEGKQGSYTVPDGVKKIGDFSFGFTAIASVTVPKTVQKVGAYAFYGSETLTNVIFESESELTEISESAFSRCGALREISFTGRVPAETGEGLFSYATDIRIHVPANVADYYRLKWSFCKDKIEGNLLSLTVYEVTFDTLGGTEVESVRAACILSAPETTKAASASEEYTFVGWFDNPEGTGEAVEFPYAVTKETTLYAVWDIVLDEEPLI